MANLSRYSLPRHTLLAPNGRRYGAAIVDAAITVLMFVILFYGCFNIVFPKFVTNKYIAQTSTYEVQSHLVMYNAETERTEIYVSDDDYKVYEAPVKYFYLNYLTCVDIEIPETYIDKDPTKYCAPDYNVPINGVLPKDYFTIPWYNENILGINVDNPDDERSVTFFTYQKDALGNYDKSVLGIPKEVRYDKDKGTQVDITSTELARYYKKQYENAYYNLTARKFYFDAASKANLYTGISAMIPILLSGLISYMIIPLFMKDYATLGKKFFKLGLANMQGYKATKWQVILRFIPYLITCAAVMLVTVADFFIVFIIVAVMILTSFGLSMASPKHSALHDYVAQTIVIDAKDSIIFDNYILEEEYIKEEDKIDEEIVMGGEEPEISYER